MGQGSSSSSEIHLDSFGYWLLYRDFESSWDSFWEANSDESSDDGDD